MYDTTPPALNLKCIVATLLLSLGYWYLPSRNKYVLLFLAYVPYLAIAWYDYIYACKHNFGPTYLANFYSWAKPQSSSQIKIYKNWDPKIKWKVHAVDFIVLAILLYFLPKFIQWDPKPEQANKKTANNFAYCGLAITVLVFIYLRFTLN
jgi:hypothetical protein